jgi:hypothetical protein
MKQFNGDNHQTNDKRQQLYTTYPYLNPEMKKIFNQTTSALAESSVYHGDCHARPELIS